MDVSDHFNFKSDRFKWLVTTLGKGSPTRKKRKRKKKAELHQNKIHCITVFIRLTALGAYYIFRPWEWALIRGGRLFEAGRLLNFHHFQQVKYVYFATKQ